MDPVRSGVCFARSTQSEVLERLMLRLWAQSMMQGPPDPLNMMSCVLLVTSAWSNERPIAWEDTDVSEITCRHKESKWLLEYFMFWMNPKKNIHVWYRMCQLLCVLVESILLVKAEVLCKLQCMGHFWLSLNSELAQLSRLLKAKHTWVTNYKNLYVIRELHSDQRLISNTLKLLNI